MKQMRSGRYEGFMFRNLSRITALAACLAILGASGPIAYAADDERVPYWASIDTDLANLRVGPGESYKIDWVYKRRNLPVKVLRREGPWRLIEDPDGARGWMRDLLLSRQRSALVKARGLVEMHAEPSASAAMRWKAEPGVLGLLLGECKQGWCELDVEGHKGFVRQDNLWGAEAP